MRPAGQPAGFGGSKLWTIILGLTLACCLFYLFWDDDVDRRAKTITEEKLAQADALLAENRFDQVQQAIQCLQVTLNLVAGTSDTIEWTLSNRCKDPVWFLPWNTPLDATFGNAHWQISHSDQCNRPSFATCTEPQHTLKYQGAMAKRVAPTASNMVQLPAAHDVRTTTILPLHFKSMPSVLTCYQVSWAFGVHAAFEPELPLLSQPLESDGCLHVRLAAGGT